MDPNNDNIQPDPTQIFLKHLETTGFVEQIKNLETSLKSIGGEIAQFNAATNQRQESAENIAAHILAMESLLTAILKKYPVKESELIGEIKHQATVLTGRNIANPAVEAVAVELLRRSQVRK